MTAALMTYPYRCPDCEMETTFPDVHGPGKCVVIERDHQIADERATENVVEPVSLNGQGKGAKRFAPIEGPSSWKPVDLAAIAEATTGEVSPSMLARTDEVPILYGGKRHIVVGEPEAGKGWFAMKATADQLQAGSRVVYLDFEDTAQVALDRLLALGVPLRDIIEYLSYIRPDGPPDIDLGGEVGQEASLAVVDGVTEAMQLLGLNPNDSIDTARFYATVGKPLVETGAGVLFVDHVVKDREGRGRWAIGSQHKIAGVDVAFSMEPSKPFGRGVVGGRSKLRLLKDRPGFLQQHTVGHRLLGEVRLDSLEDRVQVSVEPPTDTAADDFRPTGLMERVSRFLARPDGEGATGNEIRKNVTGKTEFVSRAIDCLVEEGYVEAKPGRGQSVIHANIRPFREDEGEGE